MVIFIFLDISVNVCSSFILITFACQLMLNVGLIYVRLNWTWTPSTLSSKCWSGIFVFSIFFIISGPYLVNYLLIKTVEAHICSYGRYAASDTMNINESRAVMLANLLIFILI